MTKPLTDLIAALERAGMTPDYIDGNTDLTITGLTHDSRRVEAGYVFVCVEGLTSDGHQYINSAIEKGAAAIVITKDPPQMTSSVTTIRIKDSRAALPVLASQFYDHPSRQLRVIGITGTNGKTTSTYLIRSIFEAAGENTGLIGTIAYWIGDQQFNAPFTTPESMEIQRLFTEMNAEHVTTAIMEVSSHALAFHRSDYIDFDTAIFTNLTRDHLDFHPTFEDYRDAKLKLFQMLNDTNRQRGIVNLDDSNADYFIKNTTVPVITFGIESNADVRIKELNLTLFHTDLTIETPQGSFSVRSSLRGRSNVYNVLTAVAVGIVHQIPLEIIATGIANIKNVSGRFETVDCGQSFGVIVDYAHTPDALERLLKTVREIGVNRLITVFGCGGDRDRGKRPQMGQIASELSDLAIVTSDNPRTEDPQAIINDILIGITSSNYEVIPRRRDAIEQAIRLAQNGDAVVIAGKGHEDYQIIGKTKIHFDDREEARQMLSKRSNHLK